MLNWLRRNNKLVEEIKAKNELLETQGKLIQADMKAISVKFVELNPEKVYYVYVKEDDNPNELIELMKRSLNFLNWTPPRLVFGNRHMKLYKDVNKKSKR